MLPLSNFLFIYLDKIGIFLFFIPFVYFFNLFILRLSPINIFRNYNISLLRNFVYANFIIFFMSYFSTSFYDFFETDSSAYIYYSKNLSDITNRLFIYIIPSYLYSFFLNYNFFKIPFDGGEYFLNHSIKNIFYINLSILLTGLYIFFYSLNRFLKININSFIIILFFLLPITYKYSSFAGKENLIILLISISFYLFLKIKIYYLNNEFALLSLFSLLFIFVIIISTITRPYFLTYFLSVLLLFYPYHKLKIFIIAVIISCLYFTKYDFLSLSLFQLFINNFLVTFLTPNPINFVNWLNFPFETLTNILLIFSYLFLFLYRPSLFFIYLTVIFLLSIPSTLIIFEFNELNSSNYIAGYSTRTRYPIYYFLIIHCFYSYINLYKNENFSNYFNQKYYK